MHSRLSYSESDIIISHARLRIQYCHNWKCFTYSFEGEKQGELLLLLLFLFKKNKKNIDAEVLK